MFLSQAQEVFSTSLTSKTACQYAHELARPLLNTIFMSSDEYMFSAVSVVVVATAGVSGVLFFGNVHT